MPAAGRLIEVDAERLPGWVQRFAERHGGLTITLVDDTEVVITATDGARAEVAVPYGPLPECADADPVRRLVDHVRTTRTIGVLLVRRGGWAVGVVSDGTLVAGDTGGGYVQGRTKAGGWSQQRYARRRGNQTDQVWQRAADGAAAVLVPHRADISALVAGGDRSGVAAVLADPRLTWLEPMVQPRFLSTPDPTRAVLAEVVPRLTSVAVTLNQLA